MSQHVHRNSFWRNPKFRGRWQVVSVGKFVTLKSTIPGFKQKRIPFEEFKAAEGSEWLSV